MYSAKRMRFFFCLKKCGWTLRFLKTRHMKSLQNMLGKLLVWCLEVKGQWRDIHGPSDESLTHVNVCPLQQVARAPGQRCDFLGMVSKTPVLPLNHTHSREWEEESREGRSSLIGSLSSSSAGQMSICRCTGVYEWDWRSHREKTIHFLPVGPNSGLDLCCLQILSDANALHGATAMGGQLWALKAYLMAPEQCQYSKVI